MSLKDHLPKPGPAFPAVGFLVLGERTRTIGDLSRVVRQLRGIVLTVGYAEGSGAKFRRLRRPILGTAIARRCPR